MGTTRFASALLIVFLVAGAPRAHAQGPATPPTSSAYADPSRDLGATSPSCRYALDATLRRSCRASGSAFHSYPLSAYGLDVRVGFSITDPGETFLGAIQNLLAGAWMGLLYVLKGVLLLLEWSFSLDLTGEAMPDARRDMARLHGQVFGDSWLLFGISVAGLWGVWRGLVQRRTAETLSGLAATVALMVGGLLIISDPAGTVGRASKVANEAGVAVLGAATGGQVDHPRQALAVALGGVFEATVREPWCALEFGSVDYCDARTGSRTHPTNADVWLAYPTQSWQRERLHREVRGKDDGGFDPVGGAKDILGLTDDREIPEEVRDLVDEAPDRVRMQEAGGTFPRAALLGVIAIGVLGACALYAYLGIRLLLAGAMTLLLLLLAPAMLIAPAFGDAGRATFLAWIKRLVGAIFAKLIYAVFLAAVLAASRTFAGLDIGWFGTWLLLAAFWWGVLMKRQEIVGFVSAGTPRSEGRGLGQSLAHGYYAWQLGRAARTAGRSMLARPRQMAEGVSRHRAEGREARTLGTAQAARDRIDTHGREVLQADEGRARETVARRGSAAGELRALDRRLQGYDDATAAARAQGDDLPAPSRDQQALLRRRGELRAAIDSPTTRAAGETVRRADRNRAQTGEGVTGRDLEAYRQQRVADLRSGLPVEHERNLRAAGVDPRELAGAAPERREELLARARETLERERSLLSAAEEGGGSRDARRLLDPEDVRRRTAEERRRLRDERRQRRVREGVYPGR